MVDETLEMQIETEYDLVIVGAEEYVDVHIYIKEGLRDRVIFGFKVGGVEKTDGIWSVWSEVHENGNWNEYRRIIKAKKLAIATTPRDLLELARDC
ncbi:predicted protein [Botrytis cinerea T4]|uniref:Uncharacterized protein n=1 Tax=Botryotinia fuckeliana (strain T4) TaxID=999810 RepID=G2XX05_BOTF4|nr:predicted protein [Botrytis cinerea T4]